MEIRRPNGCINCRFNSQYYLSNFSAQIITVFYEDNAPIHRVISVIEWNEECSN